MRAGVAKLGQFADVHDSFVELLRTVDRQTLVGWIADAVGLTLHDVAAIHERSTTIAALGFLRRAGKGIADVVLVLHGHPGRLLRSLILELQLSLDWSKRWTWAQLPTGLAAETRKEARVVVFTPDPVIRADIRRLLLPKIDPRPVMIDPDQIPLNCDAALARLRPRETIFAALYHARETDESIESRVAGMRAAIIAVRTLDQLEELRYGDLMLSFTPSQIMQRALEELRESEEFEEPAREPVLYKDSWAYVKGDQDGREEAREEARTGYRRLLLDILAARGIEVTSEDQARIAQCDDDAVLARLCTKASTFTGSASDLFDDSP